MSRHSNDDNEFLKELDKLIDIYSTFRYIGNVDYQFKKERELFYQKWRPLKQCHKMHKWKEFENGEDQILEEGYLVLVRPYHLDTDGYFEDPFVAVYEKHEGWISSFREDNQHVKICTLPHEKDLWIPLINLNKLEIPDCP